VSRGDLVQHVTATGTLNAVVSVDVGSQVSARVAALYVDFNSEVKKGQLLAELDPSVYAAALRQAQGELGNARATVVLKRQNLERKEALVPLRAASQADLDQAAAELAQAEAAIVVKGAAVESARANLGYCRITSPVDGVVISRKVDAGQTLAAAMTTPVLFTIAQDLRRMHISAAVSEADVGQVTQGQEVKFTVDAYPEEDFRGVVAQVRRAPTTTSNVVSYETVIDVDNPAQKLFPGMTANVSILVARRAAVLKIANAALRFTPSEATRYEQAPPAKVATNERLAYTPGSASDRLRAVVLRIGITDGIETEVVQGASEGIALVTSSTSGVEKGGFGPPRGGPPPNP
jgi:HlyD family secretion protein